MKKNYKVSYHEPRNKVKFKLVLNCVFCVYHYVFMYDILFSAFSEFADNRKSEIIV